MLWYLLGFAALTSFAGMLYNSVSGRSQRSKEMPAVGTATASGFERRRSPRQPVEGVVRIYLKEKPEHECDCVTGAMRDISLGGAGLRVEHSFEKGQRLRLVMLRSGKAFRTAACVVWWQTETATGPGANLGVRFIAGCN